MEMSRELCNLAVGDNLFCVQILSCYTVLVSYYYLYHGGNINFRISELLLMKHSHYCSIS